MRLLSGALLTLVSAAVLSAPLKPDVPPQDDELRRLSRFTPRSTAGPTPRELPAIPNWYRAPSLKQRNEAKPGLPDSGEVALGERGRQVRRRAEVYSEEAPSCVLSWRRQVPFATSNWNGTVSFWLRRSRDRPRAGLLRSHPDHAADWNDAAFWVDFEKRPESTPFRLGVFADLAVWDPDSRDFEEIPAGERPLVTVAKPPFRAVRWTHVVFTFEHFNTGRPAGWRPSISTVSPRGNCEPATNPYLGSRQSDCGHGARNYIGLFDELAFFNRLLSAPEIQSIHIMERGISSLIC